MAATVAPGAAPRRPGRRLAWIAPALFWGSFVPFAVIGWRLVAGHMGPNPIATLLNQLGLLALLFLTASLACTPIKLVTGATWPMRVRRMLGLFGFFTALSHFLVYVFVDQLGSIATLVADIGKRPFILVGFTALVLLVPVALTSSKRKVQQLGFARWKRIHRLVYVAGVLGAIHFTLRVKADTSEPLTYLAVVLGLFAIRVVAFVAAKGTRARRTALED